MTLGWGYPKDARLDDVLVPHVAFCRLSGVGPLLHLDLLVRGKLEDKFHGKLAHVVNLEHDLLRHRVQRGRSEVKVEVEVERLGLLLGLSNPRERVELSLCRRAVCDGVGEREYFCSRLRSTFSSPKRTEACSAQHSGAPMKADARAGTCSWSSTARP